MRDSSIECDLQLLGGQWVSEQFQMLGDVVMILHL